MNATPKTMARQIRVARTRKTEAIRIARVAPRTRLAFTSETGVVRPVREHSNSNPQPIDDDPHCFVCARHTDHFAEHDDMVEAGTARYGDDGSVYPVPWIWD